MRLKKVQEFVVIQSCHCQSHLHEAMKMMEAREALGLWGESGAESQG
jgi:hypothetical protein